ncbi:unnamed protein product [Rotaria sp. Silwood1]|nr:unnamed protein product [Rotaria sp. Silwood1]
MTRLKTLSIISSGLETLSDDIWKLSSLSNLTLTGNRLRSLPTSLSRMRFLERVTLDNNIYLSSLDALSGSLFLYELSASNCAIDHLPSNISFLQFINLNNNKLTSLDDLDTISGIKCQSFIFSNNYITNIPTTMTRLETLNNFDLSNNLLTELPTWVYNLKDLRSINLLNNKIDKIESEWIKGIFRLTNTSVFI